MSSKNGGSLLYFFQQQECSLTLCPPDFCTLRNLICGRLGCLICSDFTQIFGSFIIDHVKKSVGHQQLDGVWIQSTERLTPHPGASLPLPSYSCPGLRLQRQVIVQTW